MAHVWLGDAVRRNVPVGLSNVVAVAGGDGHSLALTGLPGGIAAPQLVGAHFLIGTVDRPFYYRILAKNIPTSYSASGLPPGLGVDAISGLITGQPRQSGTYSVVLCASNALGAGQWSVTLVVNLPLPSDLPVRLLLEAINGPVYRFGLSGEPNVQYTVLTTTNQLPVAPWLPVLDLTPSNGYGVFDWTNTGEPRRFFRALRPVICYAAKESIHI